MKNEYIKIITDAEAFQERVDEITGENTFDEVSRAVSRLKRALYQDRNSVALCGPQIGENLRLFVVKTAGHNSDKFKVFLNPMIVSSEGMHLSRETNDSFPGKTFIIPRKNKLHLAYQTVDGHVSSETYTGAYAEVIQQMVEMLDGITLEDYGLELDESFDNATKAKKQEIISTYLEVLKIDSKELHDEIQETPELKALDDTIRFMTGVFDGSITPINPVDENGNPVELKKEKIN